VTGFDRHQPKPRLPIHGPELLAYRQKRMRPAGRVVVTDDAGLADHLLGIGRDYPLLLNGSGPFEFRPVFGLPVLFVMPDFRWAMAVGMAIAEAQPSQFWLQWPGEEWEVEAWS
jgi:hypothetical protein